MSNLLLIFQPIRGELCNLIPVLCEKMIGTSNNGTREREQKSYVLITVNSFMKGLKISSNCPVRGTRVFVTNKDSRVYSMCAKEAEQLRLQGVPYLGAAKYGFHCNYETAAIRLSRNILYWSPFDTHFKVSLI